MNTEEDWKREREFERTCSNCHGRGWTHEGGPCGCDEPTDPPALTPRHEAPADLCASHRSMGFHIDPCCPHCEAPAEGAGEDAAWMWLNGHVECDPADRDYSADEMVDAFMAGQSAALRARSSAPEAREDGYRRVDLGMVATTIETMHRRIEELTGSRQSQYDGAVSLARDLYLTAAPSADKLRDVLVDLTSWFTKPVQGQSGMVWVIPAGERGADDALNAALAALKAEV